MYTLNKSDYNEILDLMYYCVLCLKNSGKTEGILSEILKIFKADEAVFLSPNDSYDGVNLADSFALCRDRSFLTKYANYFWRYDPLYNIQFCSRPDNLVFKTDDIIPYSQMVELDYYKSFLRPQNLLSELIIRLYSGDNTFGAISLQRYQEHSCFEMKDVLKASLLVPYLVNIFEAADRIVNIDEERILLEQWMESSSEGIVLLDSEFKPLYFNAKARISCLLINGVKEEAIRDIVSMKIPIPQIMIQDCKNMTVLYKESGVRPGHSNRIINTKQINSYYVQYFPVFSPSPEPKMPQFIIFLNELTKYGDSGGEILSKQCRLSDREEIIAQYAAIGLTNKQIAETLFVSPYTVQNHLKNIFKKTGIDSRTKLANFVKYPNNLPF